MSNPKAMSRNRLQRVETDIFATELDRVTAEFLALIAKYRISNVKQKKYPAYLPGHEQIKRLFYNYELYRNCFMAFI